MTNPRVPASIAHLAASAAGASAAIVLRAEIGQHIGEATEMFERAIRPADEWRASVTAISEVQSWFFRTLARQRSGFAQMACIRTHRGASPRMRGESSADDARDNTAKVERLRRKATEFGFRFVDLGTFEIPHSVIELVPESITRDNVCLPIAFEEDRLTVAVVDPMDFDLTEKLRFVLNRDIDFVMAPREQILRALNRYYGLPQNASDDAAERSPDKRLHEKLRGLGLFFALVRTLARDVGCQSGNSGNSDWAVITFTWIN